MIISMAPIRGLLWLLLLTTLPPPKDLPIALIIGAYCLHQGVNSREEAGQQRTASGGPERGDELLVVPDREHSQQKLLQHLMGKKID